jgi:hypothetical protein
MEGLGKTAGVPLAVTALCACGPPPPAFRAMQHFSLSILFVRSIFTVLLFSISFANEAKEDPTDIPRETYAVQQFLEERQKWLRMKYNISGMDLDSEIQKFALPEADSTVRYTIEIMFQSPFDKCCRFSYKEPNSFLIQLYNIQMI